MADKGQVRPGYNFTPLIVRKDLVDSGQVKTLRDLKGLKVANGAKGINFDFFLAKMMEHVGLTYDVLDIVYMSYPDGIKALASKAVDAAIAPEPWGAQAEKEKIGMRLFRPSRCPRSLPSRWPRSCTREVHQGAAQGGPRFLQAYVQGVKVYNQGGLKDAEVAGILDKHSRCRSRPSRPPCRSISIRPAGRGCRTWPPSRTGSTRWAG